MSWETIVRKHAGGKHVDPDWIGKPQVALNTAAVVFNKPAMELFGFRLGTMLLVLHDKQGQKLGFKLAQSDAEIQVAYAICGNRGSKNDKKGELDTGRISMANLLKQIGIKARRVRTPYFNQTQRIIEVSYAPTEAEQEVELQLEIEAEQKKAAEAKQE